MEVSGAGEVDWDREAETFDEAADHGLSDQDVRAAWADLLASIFLSDGMQLLDVGCGTGSLSILRASLGHHVTGIDRSPEMIRIAQRKSGQIGSPLEFHVMDAAAPKFPNHRDHLQACVMDIA